MGCCNSTDSDSETEEYTRSTSTRAKFPARFTDFVVGEDHEGRLVCERWMTAPRAEYFASHTCEADTPLFYTVEMSFQRLKRNEKIRKRAAAAKDVKQIIEQRTPDIRQTA